MFKSGSSDSKDALGIVAQASYGSTDEPAGRFGGDAELFANFSKALAFTVDESEAGFDSESSASVKRV